MNNKEIFASNLFHYMEQYNLSATELCEKLDFKQNTVSDWLNAKIYPRIDKIEKIADLFGIAKSDLIEQKIQVDYTVAVNQNSCIDAFKNRLNKALREKGISAAELSKMTCISESTISQYRSGYAKPKEQKLAILSNALNISPAWLMGLNVPMESDCLSEDIEDRKDDVKGLGLRLKRLRLERDMSMEMLAYDINSQFNTNITKGHISKWENEKNIPSLPYLLYFAKYFNVSSDYLVGLTNTKAPARVLAKEVYK